MNSQNKKGRTVFLIAVICLVIGALTRIAFCIRYPVQPRDAYVYESVVREWINTGMIPERVTYFPLSLWFFRVASCFVHYDIIKGGIIVNQVIGLLFIVVTIYLFSYYFKNVSILYIVGLIIATHPTLVRFSCCLLRENTFLLFASLSVYSFVCYYGKTNIATLTAASVFGALAFLCRLEGLEVIVVLFLLLLYLFIQKKISVLRAFYHAIIFIVIFVFLAITVCSFLNLRIPNYKSVKLKILPDHEEDSQSLIYNRMENTLEKA